MINLYIKILVIILAVASAVPSFAKDQKAPIAVQPEAVSQPLDEKSGQRTILYYKKDLALSDEQANQIQKTMTDFQDYCADADRKMSALKAEISDMIAKKGDLPSIKAKIYKLASIQANLSYTDVVTSRKFDSVLTEYQITKWKKMQEEYQKELAQKS